MYVRVAPVTVVRPMADRRSDVKATEKRLDALRSSYLKDIARALEAREEAHRRLHAIIAEAHDEAGLTYRAMADATGRSHEFFRAIYLRGQ